MTMTSMLRVSQIHMMDFETYESLQIVRGLFLAAGAQDALVRDLIPEFESEITEEEIDQMLSEMTEEDFD